MKNNTKDLFKVFLSNAKTLLSGVLSGLVLPKIMDVNDYGFYKFFTLYASYTVLAQIGFLDGILIKYGGLNYDELDKQKFSTFLKFFILLQLTFSAIVAFVALSFISNEYKIIFLFWAIYLVIFNVTSFYQMMSQITLRLGELAFRKFLLAVLNSIIVLCFLFFYKIFDVKIDYQMCITALLIISAALMGWYIISYKDILTHQSLSFYSSASALGNLIKNGFPVMIACFCSTFVLVLDRQFVSILFDTKTYAEYAFAYSLLSLVTVALSAASTVMYPHLKRIDASMLTQKYSYLESVLLLVSSAGMLVYYPLNIFINWFIPKYAGSLAYFRVVLPGIVISSIITIIIRNYYYALNKVNHFFKTTIMALVLSFILNAAAYFLFKTVLAISATSIVVFFIWYIVSEHYFVTEYQIKWKKNLVYLSIVITLYYFASALENLLIGFTANLFVYIFTSVLLYKEQIIRLLFKRNNC